MTDGLVVERMATTESILTCNVPNFYFIYTYKGLDFIFGFDLVAWNYKLCFL